MVIYLIGSLRNPRIPELALELRAHGYEVFDDWFAAGPEADDIWREYELVRGREYRDAVEGYHAKHVFALDFEHLNRADVGVLVLPAGKSAHLELGYIIGKGKRGYVLFDKDPERWDLMYQFADGLFWNTIQLVEALNG